jgi:hypothetical protein
MLESLLQDEVELDIQILVKVIMLAERIAPMMVLK